MAGRERRPAARQCSGKCAVKSGWARSVPRSQTCGKVKSRQAAARYRTPSTAVYSMPGRKQIASGPGHGAYADEREAEVDRQVVRRVGEYAQRLYVGDDGQVVQQRSVDHNQDAGQQEYDQPHHEPGDKGPGQRHAQQRTGGQQQGAQGIGQQAEGGYAPQKFYAGNGVQQPCEQDGRGKYKDHDGQYGRAKAEKQAGPGYGQAVVKVRPAAFVQELEQVEGHDDGGERHEHKGELRHVERGRLGDRALHIKHAGFDKQRHQRRDAVYKRCDNQENHAHHLQLADSLCIELNTEEFLFHCPCLLTSARL